MRFGLHGSDTVGILTVQGPMDWRGLEQLREAPMVSLAMSHHVVAHMKEVTGTDSERPKALSTVQRAALNINKRPAINSAQAGQLSY